MTSFSLEVDRRWKTDGGEAKEATDWFTIDAWGRLGEICQKYLAKGRLVFVDGRVQHSVLLEIFTDEGVGTEVVL